jgi:hypothetical protein
MHLCEIEALAVGQDGSGPSPVAEGQLPGAASIRSLGQERTSFIRQWSYFSDCVFGNVSPATQPSA